MRYYIYLDKCFIRNIYSVMAKSEFSVDVLELSEERGYRTSNNINIEPGFEIALDENIKNKHIDDTDNKYKKRSNRKRTNIYYGYSATTDRKKMKRYINIQDITDIKCLGFYHNLLEKLIEDSKNDEKIIKEIGKVDKEYLRNRHNLDKKNENLFKINQSYIYFNKDEIEIDLEILSYAECKISVIGYLLNENFKENYKLLKAVALYIE